ncbi:MAG: HEAT repeat domain-containing protein, partial [Crocosphaera sp.]
MPNFKPSHAIEIVAPKYGSAYRIGGRLLLTCGHLFDSNNNDCKVRFRSASNYSDKQDIAAKVIWKAPDNIDIALIELPKTIEICDPVSFGQLPDANTTKKVKFYFLGFPQFLRYSEDNKKYATGLHIEGIIDVANRAPHNRLLLNIKDNKAIQPTDEQLERLGENQSPWEGTSGAAIVCNGLVIGLISALHDEDSSVRRGAASALGNIGHEKAVEGLISALNHESSDVRWRAAQALGKIGSLTILETLI